MAVLAREVWGLEGRVIPLDSYCDQNATIETAAGRRAVLKVANRDESPQLLDAQVEIFESLARRVPDLAVPRVVPSLAGEAIVEVEDDHGRRWRALALTWLPGDLLADVLRPAAPDSDLPLVSAPSSEQAPASAIQDAFLGLFSDLGHTLARLDLALTSLDLPASRRYLSWDLATAADAQALAAEIHDPRRRALFDAVLDHYRRRVAPVWSRLPTGLIHGDANDHNILVRRSDSDDPPGRLQISGLIDFGDLVTTAIVCEPAIAAAYAMIGWWTRWGSQAATSRSDAEPAETGESSATVANTAAEEREAWRAAAAVLRGYQQVRPLSALERSVFPALVLTRLALSVGFSAKASRERPDDPYLSIHEEPAWQLLEVLMSAGLPSGPELFDGASNEGDLGPNRAARSNRDRLLESRRRHLAGSFSLSYREPLEIVRGEGQYLYDAEGRQYLDLVNNVCHVGHCHPRVVEAAHEQMSRLNTNTRYLYDSLASYSERLTGKLPEPLSVCFFVCSGSEANDLALRLSRAHTGARDVIVVDGAYHGHTSALIELSPYKFDGPGGAGLADHVRMAGMPDTYRRPVDGPAGPVFAREVAEHASAIVSSGRGLAAFFCESLLGCGGQIILPDGYFLSAYEAVRAAGGVCVADEVQVGFGRVGSHFWGFETQDVGSAAVVPDIVTLGKPIGNGHPMAAVVTTPEIAESFDNGMEYFNTFGGNPVSCAVGLAVLDVIEDEGLQARAAELGGRLKAGFEELADRHELIGDVRGLGLFLGIELVRDRETLDPAAVEATEIVERAKNAGLLLSTDGPLHNVIKIKPPMVLDEGDCERLIDVLDRIVGDVSRTLEV